MNKNLLHLNRKVTAISCDGNHPKLINVRITTLIIYGMPLTVYLHFNAQ